MSVRTNQILELNVLECSVCLRKQFLGTGVVCFPGYLWLILVQLDGIHLSYQKKLFSVSSNLDIIVILILIVTKQKVLWWYPQQRARGSTFYFKEFKELTQNCCVKHFHTMPVHIKIQALHTPHIV